MSPAAADQSRHAHLGDRAFAVVVTLLGGSVLFIVGVIVLVCTRLSLPAFAKIGFFHFLGGSDWNPVEDSFGALPFVYGTLVTSAIAIVLAMPVAIGLALFLTEMSPAKVRRFVSFFVEILAAIPSVVFGLWGLLVLVPILRDVVEPALGRWLGWIPLFSGAPLGIGFLPAGIVLAILILPTIASVTIEVLRTMPSALREGALALGATRWEAIRAVVLPYASRGIMGAVILGLARALGETMAVTMVIGNSSRAITGSLLTPGYTMASAIANQFNEADKPIYFSALVEVALVLLLVSAAVNVVARLLIWQMQGGRRAHLGVVVV